MLVLVNVKVGLVDVPFLLCVQGVFALLHLGLCSGLAKQHPVSQAERLEPEDDKIEKPTCSFKPIHPSIHPSIQFFGLGVCMW